MKKPWFRKRDFFFQPIHPAGWIAYALSLTDIFFSYYRLSAEASTPNEAFKAMIPILLLNLIVLGVIIAVTTEKEKRDE